MTLKGQATLIQLVDRQQDGIPILELSGRFDAHEATAVMTWFDKQITPESPNVVINLRGVTFIDSVALATLVRGLRRCRAKDGDLYLCSMRQTVAHVFELTRLNAAFLIYETEVDALQAASGLSET